MNKKLVVPALLFIIAIIMGILAKVTGLPRGALLWDASLLFLAASLFGSLGYLFGWLDKGMEVEDGGTEKVEAKERV